MKASRSIKPLSERFHEKYEKTDGCWIWKAAKTPKGYGLISSKPDKPLYAHRVAYELENGPIQHGMFVCHTCDNPSCVNPSHLFLGTAKDNSQDMVKKGRRIVHNPARGERHGSSKLTLEDAQNIVRARALGAKAKDLAAQYGINPNTVSNICRGRHWTANAFHHR